MIRSTLATGVRVAFFAATTAACTAPLHVHSYTERGTDLSRHRTYRFGPNDSWSTGDPRLDGNRFFIERLRQDIEHQLTARGFEKTTAARADLLVHYHASVTQEINLNDREPWECDTPSRTGTPRERRDCAPFVYDKGSLVIDLLDGRTRKVVWRGWAEGSMDGVVEDQRWMEERLDESVRRIMQQLRRTG